MALPIWTDAQVIDQLNSGLKWSGPTISYAFPTTTAGIYTGSGEGGRFGVLNAVQQSAAQLALRLWDDLIAPDMVKVSDSQSYVTANIEYGMSNTGVSYAHAYFPSVGSVWFNSTYVSGTNSLTSPTIGRHGFATYVHETGHALGLDHMGDYNGSGTWQPSSFQDSTVYSIMSYFGPSWGAGAGNGEGLVAWADWVGADGVRYGPQTPMLNDILAIQTMYGVETSTRTGDTVYGFNSNIIDTTAAIYNFVQNKQPIITIFDSAGIDTLDFSGWSTSSIINLAAGSFSSCNSMTNNIAIAYNCSIENAIGGAGSDTITGNALANRLLGGGNDDFIYALSGNDIILGGFGNDTIEGGDGIDYVYIEDTWSNVTFSYDSSAGFLEIYSVSYGRDKARDVEFFVDKNNVTKSFAELLGAPPPPSSTSASIAASAASIAEGNAGSTTAYRFTVTLSQASADAKTVSWSVVPGTANAADFSGALAGSLAFAAGQTSAFVDVSVAGDSTFEADETFTVVLSNPSTGVTLGTASAAGTIRNDDTQSSSLIGTAIGETINGGSTNDEIYGMGGNDTLYGHSGNDLLDGGSGYDMLNGGMGDDIYVVDNLYDTVNETASAGADLVRTTLGSYTLGNNVENLTYTGTAAFNGTGNSLANTITGGNAGDTINGAGGSDTLWGLLGQDKFVFNSSLGAGNIDRIMDFNPAQDVIQLENAVFRALTQTGSLASWAFNLGAAAKQSDDRIVYDTASGALYYDADGTGGSAAMQFAIVNPGLALTSANFVVI